MINLIIYGAPEGYRLHTAETVKHGKSLATRIARRFGVSTENLIIGVFCRRTAKRDTYRRTGGHWTRMTS